MISGIKKTFIFTTLIIVLASLGVTLYQISNFDEDEKIFQRVYEEQLDALLYSVNQYSEDLIKSYKFDLIELFEKSKDAKNIILSDYYTFAKMNEMSYAFRKNETSDLGFVINHFNYSYAFESKIDSILNLNEKKISKLQKYFDQGYKKIEPIKGLRENSIILLMVDYIKTQKSIIGIEINPEQFIQQNLESRLKLLSQNKFDVVITLPSSENLSEVKTNSDIGTLSRDLWILPGYKLTIRVQDDNIAALVSSKLRTNLLILVSLSVLIILSSGFLLWIFRKEMRLAQMKTDFISNVSHELRTPLALISMYSETLELGRVKDEKKRDDYYKIISGETERLSKIVNNILNFSKMEAGKRKYSFIKTEISSLIDRIINTYSFHLERNGFRISFFDKTEQPNINCDPDALSEALINLIDNAVKYSAEKKEIIVTLKSNREKIFISVKDSGIGISPKELNKIFEKFYRVSTGLRHNAKGTGIGLSIVKHIVDAHEGFINVISKENKGSEFIIELPINGSYNEL